MTYDLLMQLLHDRLYFNLIIAFVLFVFDWFVCYNLIFKLLKVKVSSYELFSMAFISGTFSFCSRPFLSILSFVPISLLLVVVLVILIRKTHLIKTIWAAIITILISSMGSTIIEGPICSFNNTLFHFFFATYWGMLISVLAEMFFPLLVLFILHTYKNISLVPPFKDTYDFYDAVAVVTYGSMFYIVLFASANLYLNLLHNSPYAFKSLGFLWITSITNVFGTILLFRNMKRKNVTLEEDIKRLEAGTIKLSEERDRIAAEKNLIIEERDRIAAEKSQIIEERDHIAVEKSRIIEERDRIAAEKSQIIAEKNMISAENNRITMEKDLITEEKNQILLEKSKLEAAKTDLEEGRNQLEQERERLIKRVQELMEKNAKGESIIDQELRDFCIDYIYKGQSIINALPNFSPITFDEESNPINLLTGKNNLEIAGILGLNQREMSIAHCLMLGKGNKEIAEYISLDVGTTSNNVSTLMRKFKLNDRNEVLPYIIRYLHEVGLIKIIKSE